LESKIYQSDELKQKEVRINIRSLSVTHGIGGKTYKFTGTAYCLLENELCYMTGRFDFRSNTGAVILEYRESLINLARKEFGFFEVDT